MSRDPGADRGEWTRLDDLLAGALALPHAEREAYLVGRCGANADLCEEARSLLADAARAAGFLGESASEFAEPLLVADRQEDSQGARDRIGPYRIEAEVGRGGMGVVYRVSRADGAFRKQLALKLVKRGLDTDEVLARFRLERQVLASMEHPGIARLLDGGMTEDGRPYLVMEYVDGQPIVAFCDARRLAVDARLALFEQVCEAVQHAHRRLVVHRDLKPSNILIRGDDAGVPRPKLLDFGIARLLDPEADEGVTQNAARRLTPAYAAPEQLRGEPVSTAADVYALGVLLYELLAGRRGDPDAPILPADAVTEEAATKRSSTVEGLRKRLRGDLDTVARTALHDSVEDRYPSVESLLDDLRRHRHGLPIQARPALIGYRLRKFVSRHLIGVATTVVAATLLVAGGLAYASAIEREKQVARQEADRAQLMSRLMRDLLGTADPGNPGSVRGDSLLLVRGQQMVREELAGEPGLQTDLLTTLGRVYRERGQYERAEALLNRALMTARITHPPPHERRIAALRELGGLRSQVGDYPEARRLFQEMLAEQRALNGEDDPSVFVTLSSLAQIEAFEGRPDTAERMHREIVALSRRIHVPTDTAHIRSVWKLSRTLYMRGKYEESEDALREVLALRRERFGERHVDVADALQWLGLILTDRAHFDSSEVYLHQALDMQRELLGPEHGEVSETLFGLGLLANERGRTDEAITFVTRSVEMSRAVLGDRHATTAFRTRVLADVSREARRYEQALALYDRVADYYRSSMGLDHSLVGGTLAARAQTLTERGDHPAALAAFEAALGTLEAAGSQGGPTYNEARVGYGDLLTRIGRPHEAEAILRPALQALEKENAAPHRGATQAGRAALGRSLAAQGHHAEAEVLLERVFRIYHDHYGPENPRTRRAEAALSDLHATTGA